MDSRSSTTRLDLLLEHTLRHSAPVDQQREVQQPGADQTDPQPGAEVLAVRFQRIDAHLGPGGYGGRVDTCLAQRFGDHLLGEGALHDSAQGVVDGLLAHQAVAARPVQQHRVERAVAHQLLAGRPVHLYDLQLLPELRRRSLQRCRQGGLRGRESDARPAVLRAKEGDVGQVAAEHQQQHQRAEQEGPRPHPVQKLSSRDQPHHAGRRRRGTHRCTSCGPSTSDSAGTATTSR